MKFPVFSLLAGNLGSRDGFARDCLLQRRVTCEPELHFSRHRPALLWIRRAREKRLPPPLSALRRFLECLPASSWSRFESPSGHAGSELFFRDGKTAASRET